MTPPAKRVRGPQNGSHSSSSAEFAGRFGTCPRRRGARESCSGKQRCRSQAITTEVDDLAAQKSQRYGDNVRQERARVKREQSIQISDVCPLVPIRSAYYRDGRAGIRRPRLTGYAMMSAPSRGGAYDLRTIEFLLPLKLLSLSPKNPIRLCVIRCAMKRRDL